MDKINFSNLPSTSTAVSAQNLNQLQTNVENALKEKTSDVSLRRSMRFIETSNTPSMQGGTVTPNTMIVAMMGDDSANKIMEISRSNGAVLKQATFTWGWCNGLTLDSVNNLVYVAQRGRYVNNSSSEYFKKVSILNYDDFSLVETINFSDYIMDVYYDDVADKLYFLSEWAYRSTNGFKVYEINRSDYSVANIININYSAKDMSKLKMQSFCVANNRIYLLSSEPKAMIVCNFNGNVLERYNLPEYADNIYYTGEYEWITYLNGGLYVGTGDNVSGINESINQLYYMGIGGQVVQGNGNEASTHAGGSYAVYVDASSTAINPDGSSSNKFKSINEATRCITPNRGCTVNIADGTYNGVCLRSRDHINFKGASQNVIIKGFDIGYCEHVVIDTATIQNCQFEGSNGLIDISRSSVYLKNINVNDSNSNLYGISVGAFSECNLSISVTVTTANSNQIYVQNDSLLILNKDDWKVQKHQKSSKIIGEGLIKLFQNPSNMCVGSFVIDSSWAYTNYEFYKYFDYMIVQYKVGSDHYAERIPLISTANRFTLARSGTADNDVTFVTCVTVDFNDTNKLRLRYSKITTRTSTGAATTVTNSSNDSPATNSIIIENVYFE